MPIFFNEYITI